MPDLKGISVKDMFKIAQCILKRSCSLTLTSFANAKLSLKGCFLLLCWDITDSRTVYVTDSLIWFEYRSDVNGKASFLLNCNCQAMMCNCDSGTLDDLKV